MNENDKTAMDIFYAYEVAGTTKEKFLEIRKILDRKCEQSEAKESKRPTKIEVITKALRDAGYVIVDYKSNYEHQQELIGLVIAPLKD